MAFVQRFFLKTNAKFLYHIYVKTNRPKLHTSSDLKHISGCITKETSPGYTHW